METDSFYDNFPKQKPNLYGNMFDTTTWFKKMADTANPPNTLRVKIGIFLLKLSQILLKTSKKTNIEEPSEKNFHIRSAIRFLKQAMDLTEDMGRQAKDMHISSRIQSVIEDLMNADSIILTEDEIARRFNQAIRGKDKKITKIINDAYKRGEEFKKEFHDYFEIDEKIMNSAEYKEFLVNKEEKMFIHSDSKINEIREKVTQFDSKFLFKKCDENTLSEVMIKLDELLSSKEIKASMQINPILTFNNKNSITVNGAIAQGKTIGYSKEFVVEKDDLILYFCCHNEEFTKKLSIGDVAVIYKNKYLIKIDLCSESQERCFKVIELAKNIENNLKAKDTDSFFELHKKHREEHLKNEEIEFFEKAKKSAPNWRFTSNLEDLKNI